MRMLANHVLRAMGVAFLFFLFTSAVLPRSSQIAMIECTGGWFSVGRSEPIESAAELEDDLVLKAYGESLDSFFEQYSVCAFDLLDLEEHLEATFGNLTISSEAEPCTYKYTLDLYGNLVAACVPTQELVITGPLGGPVHVWICTIEAL